MIWINQLRLSSAQPLVAQPGRLAAMTDLRTFWPVGNTPSDEISIYEAPQVFIANTKSLLPGNAPYSPLYWLQAEVLNGGLLQFFSNDTGVLAPEAVAACRSISMPCSEEQRTPLP